MLDIWRETADVRFGSVDCSDRLTLWKIFDFFQEAAISHATALGFGREDMAASGQAWILSRLSIFVERRPAYRETVEISTWPRRGEKLLALRDYMIKDAEGIPVVRGRGGWLVLDIERRRPLRAQTIMERLPPNEGVDAFPSGPAGLTSREGLVKTAERTALYSDIDYLGHVNNARYIQWIQDALDRDIISNASQIRLDINYLSELLPGEKIEIWIAPLESIIADDYPSEPGAAFVCEGRKPASNGEEARTAFRAEIFTSQSDVISA